MLIFIVSCKNSNDQQTIQQLTNDEKSIVQLFDATVIQKVSRTDSLQKIISGIDSLTITTPSVIVMREVVKANFSRRSGHFTTAEVYFKRAKELHNGRDSLSYYIYYGLGSTYKSIGNFPEGSRNLYQAVAIGEQLKDTLKITQAYSNLSQLQAEKGDYDDARKTLNKIFSILRGNTYMPSYLNAMHTLANIEGQTGNIKEAMKLDVRGIAIADSLGDQIIKVMYQDNLARCYLAQDSFERARYYFKNNQQIEKPFNNPGWNADTEINLAEVETNDGNYALAEAHLDNAVKIFSENKQLINTLKAYTVYELLYQKQGKWQKALEVNQKYQEVYANSINEKSEQSYAEFNTLFETQQKEKKISEMKLQVAQADLRAKQKNVLLLILLSVVAIVLMLFRNHRVKSKLESQQLLLENNLLQEKALNVAQEQRLQISRDLHDSLGAQLTFVNSVLDGIKKSTTSIDESLKSKIETVSEFSENAVTELKNTLWVMNLKSINVSDLKFRIANYINSAAEAKEEIRFHFNFEIADDIQIQTKSAMNIFRVIQEIVNNAIKYSHASEVSISIHQNKNELLIDVRDNGVGFDVDEMRTKSFGLNNIYNRVSDLKGTVDLVSGEDLGTQYKIKCLL
ncbi:MAG TPA: tetratricopeptide repeat protein [Bacteroidia bacterium]|nr:tetratricopeptide repeat protein [Bacteroidia bacterium]MBP8668269.1 tetratricopeptide repeat protein [Bacteroidia bacterium]HQW49768.1 tetratricopeptide repeat protein [Bacteroidia bacterium]HQX70024.1 tetratricopeptide repeat protein [Bacteroidia bacterium]HQZ76916.1 tetratricopeptide repeat protein [Bacteroidia bacterium]